MQEYELGDKVVIDYDTTPCKIISKYVNEGEYRNRGKTFVDPYYARVICKRSNVTVANLKRHINKIRTAFPQHKEDKNDALSAFEQRIIDSYFGGDPTKTISLYCVHLIRAEEFGSEACDKLCWACEVCDYCVLCDGEQCGTQDLKNKQMLESIGYCCKFHAV